jgi:ABC-type glycerol-3-phosphate transport system substrate-binding protein
MLRKITIFFTIATLVFIGAGCLGGGTGAPSPITLEYWRADEDPEVLSDVLEAYRKLHPHITINVSSFNPKDYENMVLSAMAEGRGPDLFNLPNTSLGKWRGKLLPLPTESTIATQIVDENRNIVWSMQKKPTMTLRQMRDMFAQTVIDELTWNYAPDPKTIPETRIWGVAYSLDNLALFYNNELLRKANIETPPRTWSEFQQSASKMTFQNDEGEILQSGAAIGGSSNVKYSTELLATLMAQNGANLGGEYRAEFDRYTADTQELPSTPGVQALVFYQSFANERSRSYAWTKDLPNSLDAFVEGKAAMFFGLPSDRDLVRKRAPRLDFSMTILPQINQANKWNAAVFNAEVVSRLTNHPNEAWDFLQFAADPDNVVDYLEATKRPAAALSLIDAQKLDPDIAPFAQQALISKTWYQGLNYKLVEDAFRVMIDWRPTEERPNHQYIVNLMAKDINTSYY